MDFAKGWERIQRLLLIIAVIVSASAILDFSIMMTRICLRQSSSEKSLTKMPTWQIGNLTFKF
mgnify:CR=1 FL=1